MRRLLRRRDREGLTYARLALLTGESRHALSWWAWKLRHEERALERSSFVELAVEADSAGDSTGVEVLLANGRRLLVQRGFDDETLRRAVAVLERTC